MPKVSMSLLEKLEHESLKDFYFIATALILAFGILQTTGTVLNTDKPVVSVVSCSMYPQLNVGDVLIVNGQPYETIEEDDVIVYSVKEADINIDGESYHIEGYKGQTYDTPAGEIELLGIVNARDGPRSDPTHVNLRIDGQRETLKNGNAYEINGKMVEVESVTGLDIPVVHRVIEKNEDYLQTRGIDQEQLPFEKRVEPNQIHGTVLFPVPRIGGLKILLMDLVGFSGDQPFVIDMYPNCQAKS